MNCQCNSPSRNTGNLVYLNKVYFDQTQESCPILYSLATTAETFTQQLSFGQMRTAGSGCRCGCSNGCCCGCGGCFSDFTVTPGTTFRITDARVIVTGFNPSTDAVFTSEDVTIDGFPVTELVLVNGQYAADLSGIMNV
ncbi:MAG: hypothetical protein IKV72_07460, partial [Firmicutes bacterium]|nr:hypothetical protein [Bacillota bacterium]